MDYTHADPSITWTEWLEANPDADATIRLAALREYIIELARNWAGRENITAEWINKKLAKLGIGYRIVRAAAYTLSVPVTADLSFAVYATNRAEAMQKFTDCLRAIETRHATVLHATYTATPVFTDGPEDPDLSVVDPDAPQTEDATLAMLREIIMLAVVAGPRICEPGANTVLSSFGLPDVPARKTFTVTRPVEATATTVVEAFDEASAMRVAGWRWEDGRSGYTVNDLTATDAPSLAVTTN